jgi:hypothetical protein
MNVNIIGNVVALMACMVAFSYVWGIWRMVKAPSRLVLVITLGYMLATRLLVFYSELETIIWVEDHRSLLTLPVYPLFALAFGMTYYELRSFHFERRLPTEQEEEKPWPLR